MTTLIEGLDLPAASALSRSRRDNAADTVQFAEAALARAKNEGLRLAVRARYIALGVIACLLPILNPAWDQLRPPSAGAGLDRFRSRVRFPAQQAREAGPATGRRPGEK